MVEPQQSSMPEDEATERERLRFYTTLGTVLLAVVVVIVVLLFWRTCGADQGSRVARGGGGIVDVLPGKAVQPGDVAVWLMPGTNIDDVLARYGLEDAPVTSFGEGTYVVSVGDDADTESLVERMRRDPSLYDAGFVYFE